MSSYQNTHIFSQGNDLSQLTCGFPSENNSGNNEDREHNIEEAGGPYGQDETPSSRAEAICEKNRQINRFVELSLKQLEKKRIMLINKKTSHDEEIAQLLETHKRQSEQNLELQMNVEEMSTKYANELSNRNKIVEKLKQIEDIINHFEQNLVKGIEVGDGIEESKQHLKSEFDTNKKKSKSTQEKMNMMKSSVRTELKKYAQKCKDLKDSMMKEREIGVRELRTSAFENEETSNRISAIKEEIENATQAKEELTQSYNSVIAERKVLNESVTEIYQELNETKTVNSNSIQHLKLQINTEENTNHNQEIELKEKETTMQNVMTKLKELSNLSNQMQEAVIMGQNNIEKNTKEIDLYKKKKSVLNGQISSLSETLRKYECVENQNQFYKDKISSLKEDINLNTSILLEKENIVDRLSNEINELEEKLTCTRKNKTKLDKELENDKIMEAKLTFSVRENKTLKQQEREKKLAMNESLRQRNEELSSEIATGTLSLKELGNFDENAKEKEEEMKNLIKSFKETVKINEDKYLKEEEEQKTQMEEFEGVINSIRNQLDKCEFFVTEAKPKQKELSKMLEEKLSLEQEIQLLSENNQKKISTLETTHSSKIQEMDNEMEKYSSIMKNIITAEEETTDKIKEDIKTEEKIKIKLEEELRVLNHKLKSLKNKELVNRNKIARMEKRQQTIMNEIKVSREDIAQAVNGKMQEPQPVPVKNTKLMTPSSSAGSRRSLHGEIGKKIEAPRYMPNLSQASKKESTRQWLESVPDDDYEFTEV